MNRYFLFLKKYGQIEWKIVRRVKWIKLISWWGEYIMNYKSTFFLICSMVLLCILMLSNSYAVVLAEKDSFISDTMSGFSVNDLLEKIDLSEEKQKVIGYNEDFFKSSISTKQIEYFDWDTVPCSFDDSTGTLIIGGGEVRAEFMKDNPFNSLGGLYPHHDKIEEVIFEDKIKFNGSADHLFSYMLGCGIIENLENIDTSNVTDMTSMFGKLKLFHPIDISTWDTSNVTSMRRMFYEVGNVQTPATIILNTEVENLKLTDISEMFQRTYFEEGTDFHSFDTSNVENMDNLFAGSSNIKKLDLSSNSMAKMTSGSDMFYYADIDELILPDVKPESLVNMSSMFRGLKVESLNSMEKWDTSDVVNMDNLFAYSELKNPPISNFDMSSVETSVGMFARMNKLEALNFGKNFNTGNITDMSDMFAGITYKNLDLSFFDTSSVITIDTMFQGSKIELLDLSNWDNSKLESMDSTFSGGSILEDRGYIKELILSDFDTSNVADMSFLFYYSNIDKFDFSSLDVSSVTSMSGMFRASSFEEFDFSTWDTGNVTDMSQMFSGDLGNAANRNPIPMNFKKLNLTELNTDSLEDSYRMFANLTDLEELNLGSFPALDDVDTDSMLENCTNLAKIELNQETVRFPEDTELPEIATDSIYPTSWISEKSNLFFETTNDFIANYHYELTDESNEILIRSFKYKVQYTIGSDVKVEDDYLYNEEIEVPNYINNRYEVSHWLDFELGTKYFPNQNKANIGVSKTDFGKTVTLEGTYKEREVALNMYWKNSNTDQLKTSMDIGEKDLSQSIVIHPELELDPQATDTDKQVSYKIDTYLISGSDKELLTTTDKTFDINTEASFLYDLEIDELPEGESFIELDFYQLSVTKEGQTIGENPSGNLSVLLTKDRSFSIVGYTDVLQWNVKESDSKGTLSRSAGNELYFLILNSVDQEYQWGISLTMEFPDSLPFDFIWKENEEAEGQSIEQGTPITITSKEDFESIDSFKHKKSFGKDAGVLIKSKDKLPIDDYSNDVKLHWVLSSHPNFN